MSTITTAELRVADRQLPPRGTGTGTGASSRAGRRGGLPIGTGGEVHRTIATVVVVHLVTPRPNTPMPLPLPRHTVADTVADTVGRVDIPTAEVRRPGLPQALPLTVLTPRILSR